MTKETDVYGDCVEVVSELFGIPPFAETVRE